MSHLRLFDDLTEGDLLSVRWRMGTQPYVTRGYFRGFIKSNLGNYRIMLTKRRNEASGFLIHTKSIVSLQVESVGC